MAKKLPTKKPPAPKRENPAQVNVRELADRLRRALESNTYTTSKLHNLRAEHTLTGQRRLMHEEFREHAARQLAAIGAEHDRLTRENIIAEKLRLAAIKSMAELDGSMIEIERRIRQAELVKVIDANALGDELVAAVGALSTALEAERAPVIPEHDDADGS